MDKNEERTVDNEVCMYKGEGSVRLREHLWKQPLVFPKWVQ